ncbi:hypothetical protein M413DRAFT_286289 [Hebeloma cylindrosporum]|uniref:Uncharacterized protein n=1 Tax=Hebeloma cylindrosporum TaxID=76867 RepID=A0A0C3BYZ5_HEBCY|nr:hypothetical protein M413DRAFT_286289 [Hebeloma cylindrosporum h7]
MEITSPRACITSPPRFRLLQFGYPRALDSLFWELQLVSDVLPESGQRLGLSSGSHCCLYTLRSSSQRSEARVSTTLLLSLLRRPATTSTTSRHCFRLSCLSWSETLALVLPAYLFQCSSAIDHQLFCSGPFMTTVLQRIVPPPLSTTLLLPHYIIFAIIHFLNSFMLRAQASIPGWTLGFAAKSALQYLSQIPPFIHTIRK